MVKFTKLILLNVLVFGSMNGYAGEQTLEASRQVTININANVAWDLLRDFNGLNNWHPAVEKSKLHGNGATSGDIRVLTLEDGALIYDELIKYEEGAKVYTYKVISAPLPITDYVGSLKVIPKEQDSSTIIWSSSFIADGASDEEAVQIINDIYEAGLNALPDYFKNQ